MRKPQDIEGRPISLKSATAILQTVVRMLLETKRWLRDDERVSTGVMKMKIFVLLLSSAFVVATISISSSDAYAARRGTMSGIDNTYGSQKGQKCVGGTCTPAGATKGKKKP
jgi:hypothetical protein